MSYANQTFSAAFSQIFGVSNTDAAELHDTIATDLFDRGHDLQGASDQSYDEIQNGLVSTLGHAVVYDYGRKVALLVLGSLAVFALPEEILILLGIAAVFVIVKSTTATAVELREWVRTSLDSIFSNVQKGFFDTPAE